MILISSAMRLNSAPYDLCCHWQEMEQAKEIETDVKGIDWSLQGEM